MNKKIISLLTLAAFSLTMAPGIKAKAINSVPDIKDIKGSLVIVGGALGSSNEEVYEKFIELAGGDDSAKIGIIPAASSKLTSSNDFKKDLIKYGVKEENISILPLSKHDFKKTDENEEETWKSNENKDEIVNKIKDLTGIWMVGGDQTLITETLYNADGSNSKALNAMWEIYKNGAVLGGSSAGAAVMSESMLAGGDSLGTLTYGFTHSYDNIGQQEYGPSYILKGFGFFPYGTVDQHFDEKARLGRLILTSYEKQSKDKFSFGIDEDTAMVVENSKDTMEVVGRGGITVVDVSKAKKNEKSALTDMDGVRISYLADNDKFNLEKKEYQIYEKKDTTTGYEYYNYAPTPHRGLLDNYSTLTSFISNSLMDNAGTNKVTSYLYDDKGRGFELDFIKDKESEGYYYKKSYSFTNVELNIDPIKVSITEDFSAGSYKPANFKYTPLGVNPDDIKGNLVIVGGALDPNNAAIYNKFIDLAGGKEKAKIGIIPTASVSLESSEYYVEDFINYGVPKENITILPLTNHDFEGTDEDESTTWKDNENKTEVVDTIKSLTGIFMVGGEQDRITNTLYNEDGTNSKALDAMWQIYKNGAVLSGSSAGAAVMSEVMFNGGDSFGALRDGYTNDVSKTYGDDIVPSMLLKGLGFFSYGIVDQHFVARARFGRLIQGVHEAGIEDKLSFGIDENTALVINNLEKTADVIGASGVTIIDMSKSTVNSSMLRPNYKDIRYSFIKPGDEVNLKDNSFKISASKDSTKGYEYNEYIAPPNTGVLTNHGRLNNFLAYALVDNLVNKSVDSYGFDDKGTGFKLTFRNAEDSNGYWGYSDGQKDDYSIVNVAMDITPIKTSIIHDNNQSISPLGVHINEKNIELKAGDSITLTTLIDGTNALNKEIAWSSSDETIAKVDDKGKVTAIKEGKVMVTATTVDGKKSSTTEITIIKASDNSGNGGSNDNENSGNNSNNNPGNQGSNNSNNTSGVGALPQAGTPIGSTLIILLGIICMVSGALFYKRKTA